MELWLAWRLLATVPSVLLVSFVLSQGYWSPAETAMKDFTVYLEQCLVRLPTVSLGTCVQLGITVLHSRRGPLHALLARTRM